MKIAITDSKEEQKEVVNKLDNLSKQTKKLQKLYQQKLENLQELKKSLLDKAFKGEL
jgi:type I restriction enzyme S subunit